MTRTSESTNAPKAAVPAYERPRLERLGAWSALTLVQTICVGDGCAIAPGMESSTRTVA